MRSLVLVLALAGCASLGPDYKRPAAELPAGYPVASAEKESPIQADWWKLYRDPVLDELVASARANNADIRLAAAQVLEVEAVLRQVDAASYPEVSAVGTRQRTRVSEATVPPPARGTTERPDARIALQTTFEIDFWGRLSRSSEAARASLLASRYAREVVALTQSSLTAQAYFSLRSLDAQRSVLAETIRARRDSVDLARARLGAGLASELDLHQAQGALSEALVQRREADRQRSVVERQLGSLTGKTGLVVPQGDLFTVPVPPTPPAGLPSTLLERRPDIRASEQQLAAANAQIGVAKAALFPTITLTGSLGSQSAAFSDLLSNGTGIWSIAFAAALPVFDAGRRQAAVGQAEARRTQALIGYQKSIETGFREVADALVSYEQSSASETDLAERLAAARAALKLSGERYQAGYSPYLEVLDAHPTANDAELAFVRNRQARLAYSIDLMKALGGGWSAASGLNSGLQ
jgi:multidrug efflux system outer membrane protein